MFELRNSNNPVYNVFAGKDTIGALCSMEMIDPNKGVVTPRLAHRHVKLLKQVQPSVVEHICFKHAIPKETANQMIEHVKANIAHGLYDNMTIGAYGTVIILSLLKKFGDDVRPVIMA